MSGFGELFRSGMFIGRRGVEMSGRDGKKDALVLKAHDRSVFTRLHLKSILPAYPHAALLHYQ